MKIRLTVLTENDKHVNVPKEELERKTKAAWNMFFAMLSESGETATIEKCEVVEM